MKATKIFVLEHGELSIIRDNSNNEVAFESLKDLERCTGMVFAGKHYIGYEPDINFFSDSEDEEVTTDLFPHEPYEWLINNIETLQARKDNPTYGLTGDALLEAQDVVEIEAAEALFYTEINTPVTVTVVEGTFTFSGGAESAMFINNAVLLSDQLSESDTQLVDINSQVFTFGKQSAKDIAVAVGVAFRSSYFKLRAEQVKIKNK